MASWNIPALINKISDDVPAIKALLTALFKWTDAGTEDVPEGAKRLQSVTGGRQIQEYSGSSWGSVGKLMHDVDMLDGKHASTAQTPDTIPVRDANGSIPGNITGNAATATTASSVSSEYVVPIANGGTGATSAANARTNLGTNNAENITTGVLATARGGTGRSDGKVTDVFLTDYQTGAVGLGQLGPAVTKNAVNCDSLTRAGKFYCTGGTRALNYPRAQTWMLNVDGNGSTIVQQAYSQNNNETWRRVSTDGGASWSGWLQNDFNIMDTFTVFISKGGSDSNTGLSADDPVLTWDRAARIARGISGGGVIVFCFGPGEWGEVYVNGNSFQSSGIKITNYSDSNAATIADFEALTGSGNTGNQPPHFTHLVVDNARYIIGNINIDNFQLADVLIVGFSVFKFASSTISKSVFQCSSFIVNKVDGVTSPVFTVAFSEFQIQANAVAKFVNSPANSMFIYSSDGSNIFVHSTFTHTGTFGGRKFFFEGCVNVRPACPMSQWPGAIEGVGNFFANSVLNSNGAVMHIHNGGVVKGTYPNSSQFYNINFDEAGMLKTAEANLLGLMQCGVGSNGNTEIRIVAYKNEAGSTAGAVLGIRYQADGTKYAFAPTIASTGDNSDIVATTKWVRQATGNTSLNAATATYAASAGTAGSATKATQDGDGNSIAGTYVKLAGEQTITGKKNFNGGLNVNTILDISSPVGGGEGGEIHLNAAVNGQAYNGIVIDQQGGYLRIFGIPSADGTSVTGVGTPLSINPYTLTVGGGYEFTDGRTNTPAANDNSGRLPNTAWVRARLGNGEFGMVPNGPWQWLSTNTTYNASSNGYVYARNSKYSSCGQQCKITVNAVEYWMQNTSYGSGSCNSDNVVIVPIKKGWPFRGNNLDVLGFLPA